MLGRLQREAAFDHAEAPWWPWTTAKVQEREDPRQATITRLQEEKKNCEATITSLKTQVQTLQRDVQKLTQKVKNEQMTGTVEILKQDRDKGELQKRTVYQWWLDGEITTLTVEEKEKLKRSNVIKNHTEVDELYQVHTGSGYAVKNIIFLSPDKLNMYNFFFESPLAVFNKKVSSSTCIVTRKEVNSATTINDICTQLYLKDIDLVLDMQWQRIDAHVEAPIQPVIMLESIQERIERDKRQEEERKKLRPNWNPNDHGWAEPQHWR